MEPGASGVRRRRQRGREEVGDAAGEGTNLLRVAGRATEEKVDWNIGLSYGVHRWGSQRPGSAEGSAVAILL